MSGLFEASIVSDIVRVPLHFVKLLYAQLLLRQLAMNDALIYENLFSPTNIGFASHNRTDSVVVTSNVAEHTENAVIYNTNPNVYLLSNHSITLDLGLLSACVCTVADHATTCLPFCVDFVFVCICSHYNMQSFFYFRVKQFYVQPVNFSFNYLDDSSLTIFIRGQKKTLSSCILHFDSKNVNHLILLLLLSGQIKTNPGPIKSN